MLLPHFFLPSRQLRKSWVTRWFQTECRSLSISASPAGGTLALRHRCRRGTRTKGVCHHRCLLACCLSRWSFLAIESECQKRFKFLSWYYEIFMSWCYEISMWTCSVYLCMCMYVLFPVCVCVGVYVSACMGRQWKPDEMLGCPAPSLSVSLPSDSVSHWTDW